MLILLPNSFVLGERLLDDFANGLPNKEHCLFSLSAQVTDSRDKSDCQFLGQDTIVTSNFSQCLTDILREKGQQNIKVLLVWPAIDEMLLNMISFLRKNSSRKSLNISVVLSQAEDNDKLKKLSEFNIEHVVQSIWYIGNEDNAQAEISSSRRIDLLHNFLKIILHLKDTDKGVAEFLFPQKDVEPHFVAFGIQSWLPGNEQTAEVRQRLTRRIIFQIQQSKPSGAEPSDDAGRYTKLVGSMFEELEKFGIAAENTAEIREAFADKLSVSQVVPFQEWSCPFMRAKAIASGQHFVEDYRKTFNDYHAELKKQVAELAPVIRKNGQDNFAEAKKRFQDFIQNESMKKSEHRLFAILRLLKDFFPAVEKQLGTLGGCASCEALSSPSNQIREIAFVLKAKAKIKELCEQELPSNKVWISYFSSAFLILVVSFLSFRYQFDWRITLSLVIIPILIILIFLVYVQRKGSYIKEQMIEYYQRQFEWLHTAYKQKITWLVENTRYLVWRQLISELQATGRRLSRNFGMIFSELYASDGGQEEALRNLGVQMNLENEDLEKLKKIILAEIDSILWQSLDSTKTISGMARIHEAKVKWDNAIIQRLQKKEIQLSEEQWDEIAGNIKERQKPTIASRVNLVPRRDELMTKYFVYPVKTTFSEKVKDAITTAEHSEYNLQKLPSSVIAPALILIRRNLSLDDMVKTLAITEVR